MCVHVHVCAHACAHACAHVSMQGVHGMCACVFVWRCVELSVQDDITGWTNYRQSTLHQEQLRSLNEKSFHVYVMSSFFFAFLTALAICVARGLLTLSQFSWLHGRAGFLLGIVNYVAVYALVKALALEGWQSSQLLPIYSVGVIAVSSGLAVLFFRETLSRQRTVGLVVGLVAVVLLNQ